MDTTTNTEMMDLATPSSLCALDTAPEARQDMDEPDIATVDQDKVFIPSHSYCKAHKPAWYEDRAYWPGVCGHDKPFNFGKDSISSERFLDGLLSLPETVRDQIYDLVVFAELQDAEVPPPLPAVWLGPEGFLTWALMPTLEAKSGDWPYRGTNDEMPYYELSFCQSRGFTQQLHNMGRNSSTAAGRCLADFLGFLGERIVLELNAYLFYYWRHEITRLASFELLKDLKPYHNYINHISLEYCVGLDRIGNLVKLCEYTQSSLKSLKSIIFWFQITKRQLNAVLQSPNEQEWFRACKLLAVEKIEVKLRIVGRVPRHWTGDPREDGLPPSHILARSNVWNQRYPREGGYEDKEMAAMLKKILTPGRDWGLTDDLQEDFGMGRLFGDDGTSMNEA